MKHLLKFFFAIGLVCLFPLVALAGNPDGIPSVGSLRVEFILFALVLVGVAVFYKKTFLVALIGLAGILVFKFIFDPGFHLWEHLFGHPVLLDQLLYKSLRQGEWFTLLNLLGLLLGFAVLARIFRESAVPEILPRYLPDGWKGPFVLLVFIFILSSFLDNIAAALIGGTIALVVFKNNVHLGYIVAIVAASNAGGSGSVVGDTTTTMMWIDGVNPLNVLHAYIAAVTALLFFGWFASRQQNKFKPINREKQITVKVDWVKLLIVVLILIGAILSNFLYDMPALGVWCAIILGALFRKMPWREVSHAIPESLFLLCLTFAASMMPIESLPDASISSTFILGLFSAVINNIPLTKLCLEQGHYDWGMLAYAVGFGGSMIWFGSSAGVAITNIFSEDKEVRSVFQWVKKGWHVSVAYVVGFIVLLFVMGWEPASNDKHKEPATTCTSPGCRIAAHARAAQSLSDPEKDK